MPDDTVKPGESRQVDGYDYTVSREDAAAPLALHDQEGNLVGELMDGGPEHSGYGEDEWVLRLHPSTMLHGLGEQPSESDAIRQAC